MGQPASGKTELTKSILNSKKFIILDYFYNKKSDFYKLVYFLKHTFVLNNRYKYCKKIVKKSLVDRDPIMKKFFLRQFRLDYCLISDALKLSGKGNNCILSENFYNLFSYIFFYNKDDYKIDLFKELMRVFPKEFLFRDAIISINVNIEKNLEYKSKREGFTKEKFAKDSDFYNDFSLVKKCQSTVLELLKEFADRILYFDNNYDSNSIESFTKLIDSL